MWLCESKDTVDILSSGVEVSTPVAPAVFSVCMCQLFFSCAYSTSLALSVVMPTYVIIYVAYGVRVQLLLAEHLLNFLSTYLLVYWMLAVCA